MTAASTSILPVISILIVLAPWAEAQMVGGTISGDVVDPAGSAVAQAEVRHPQR